MTLPKEPSDSDKLIGVEATAVWQVEGQFVRMRAAARHDLAAALGEQLLETREAALGPTHEGTLKVAEELAESYLQILGYDRAEELFRRVLAVYNATPAAPEPEVLKALHGLARVLVERGEPEQLDEAEALARRTEAIERRRGAEQPESADALVLLSKIAERREDTYGALRLMMAAFQIRAKRPELDQGIEDMTRLGTLLLDADEPEQASGFLRDALDLAARSRGEEHPSVVNLIFLAARVAMAEKDPEQALVCLDHAIKLGNRVRGRTHNALAEPLLLRAEAHIARGSFDKAEEDYLWMTDIYAANHPPGSPWQCITLVLRGDLEMRRKAPGRAAELFEQALVISEEAFGVDSIQLGRVLDKAAEAHLDNGALARCEALSQRLLVMYERHFKPDHPALLPCVRRLATVYMKTGDARAEEMLERTLTCLSAATLEVQAETARHKATSTRNSGLS